MDSYRFRNSMTAEEGEKEGPDTHRITRNAGPTSRSEFNTNPGSGPSADQHSDDILGQVVEAATRRSPEPKGH